MGCQHWEALAGKVDDSIREGRGGQTNRQQSLVSCQAQRCAIEAYYIRTFDLHENLPDCDAGRSLEAPGAIAAAQHQIHAGVEIDIAHASPHRHIWPPLRRVVADEVADGSVHRREWLDAHVRVATEKGEFQSVQSGRLQVCRWQVSP